MTQYVFIEASVSILKVTAITTIIILLTNKMSIVAVVRGTIGNNIVLSQSHCGINNITHSHSHIVVDILNSMDPTHFPALWCIFNICSSYLVFIPATLALYNGTQNNIITLQSVSV